jgi:hypothetical protein
MEVCRSTARTHACTDHCVIRLSQIWTYGLLVNVLRLEYVEVYVQIVSFRSLFLLPCAPKEKKRKTI